MKTYTIILKMTAVAAAALSLLSCEKFLIRDAENQTTEEAWWYNKSILSTVVSQCYAPMPGGSLTGSSHIDHNRRKYIRIKSESIRHRSTLLNIYLSLNKRLLKRLIIKLLR